jgi:mono/diheme cytochrome c family protein
MRTLTIAALLMTAVAVVAVADEKPVQLKTAEGIDRMQGNCASCHSLDHVLMNSPFPNAAVWDATVTKMIKAFGAPIDEADAKVIVDYHRKLPATSV